MPMTHNNNETEPSGRRTFPWKGRSPRAAQQQQNQLLQPPEFTSIGSSSDVPSYFNGYSDTISIPSRTSSEHSGNIGADKNRPIRCEPVAPEDFHEYFTKVPLDDPLLHDFYCTLRTDQLVHGQLFITKLYLCFKSTTPDHPTTTVEFKIGNIKLIELVRPGRWKPRMIQITLKNDAKYTFTAFLPSTTSRDEAYQCLMQIWKPSRPAMNISASSSSTPTLSTLLQPTMTTISKSTPECDESDTTTSDNNKSNESLATTAPTTPVPAGPFKLFQRRRAQTMTPQAQQDPPKTQSATSFNTPLAKSLSTQIIWNDGQPQHRQRNESDPPTLSSSPPSILPHQPRQPSISKNKKKKKPSSTSIPPPPPPPPIQQQHFITRINTRTMLMMVGFVLLLSHAFLTYEFYRMTHLLTTNRQLQQQQQTALSLQRQRYDTSWLSDQLEKATKDVQRWEKETMQQRRRLMDMIPS